MASEQQFFCCVCGNEMEISVKTPYFAEKVCCSECDVERQWRESLSRESLAYYSNPNANYTGDGYSVEDEE